MGLNLDFGSIGFIILILRNIYIKALQGTGLGPRERGTHFLRDPRDSQMVLVTGAGWERVERQPDGMGASSPVTE